MKTTTTTRTAQYERTEYGITLHCAKCAATYDSDLHTENAAELDAMKWAGWQYWEFGDGYSRLVCHDHDRRRHDPADRNEGTAYAATLQTVRSAAQ